MNEDLIETAEDFSRTMAMAIRDLQHGKMTPQIANAIANVGGKMLRARDLQEKYGRAVNGETKRLQLVTLPAPHRKNGRRRS